MTDRRNLQVKTRLFICWLVLVTQCVATAPDSIVIGGMNGLDARDSVTRYSIALALSGGGARGLASIGVLRAFEENGIEVAAIAGTSIGGVVGGLYACGYTSEQLSNIVRGTDFGDLFANRPSRLSMFLTQRQERDRHLVSLRLEGLKPQIPQALTAGQQLTSILSDLTARGMYQSRGDFGQLKIPFRAVTTDIVSGRMEVLSSGSLPGCVARSPRNARGSGDGPGRCRFPPCCDVVRRGRTSGSGPRQPRATTVRPTGWRGAAGRQWARWAA